MSFAADAAEYGGAVRTTAMAPSATGHGSARGHFGAKRAAPVAGVEAISPEQRDDDAELRAARRQAADEARRLAEPAATEGDRCDALDDLATRLEALARHLESCAADAAALWAIIKLLRDDTVGSSERWDRARAALSRFAEGATTSRPAFWKRH
jgi:hypothetical protein